MPAIMLKKINVAIENSSIVFQIFAYGGSVSIIFTKTVIQIAITRMTDKFLKSFIIFLFILYYKFNKLSAYYIVYLLK